MFFTHVVQRHQEVYSHVELLKGTIRKYYAKLINIVKTLDSAQKVLGKVLDEALNREHVMDIAEARILMLTAEPTDLKSLLSYGQRVAKHTISPVDANSWIVEPPIPQDSNMRLSILFKQDALFNQLNEGNFIYFILVLQEADEKVEDMDVDLITHSRQAIKADDALLDLDLDL